MEKNIENWQIFNSWSILHKDYMELTRAGPICSIVQEIQKLRSFCFQLLIFMQKESNNAKKVQVFLTWLSCVFFRSDTIDCAVFKISLNKTASFQLIDTRLSKAGKTAKFADFKDLVFAFLLFLLHDSRTSVLLKIL